MHSRSAGILQKCVTLGRLCGRHPRASALSKKFLAQSCSCREPFRFVRRGNMLGETDYFSRGCKYCSSREAQVANRFSGGYFSRVRWAKKRKMRQICNEWGFSQKFARGDFYKNMSTFSTKNYSFYWTLQWLKIVAYRVQYSNFSHVNENSQSSNKITGKISVKYTIYQ